MSHEKVETNIGLMAVLIVLVILWGLLALVVTRQFRDHVGIDQTHHPFDVMG